MNCIFVINKFEEVKAKEFIKSLTDNTHVKPIFVVVDWANTDWVQAYEDMQALITTYYPEFVFVMWISNWNIFVWNWELDKNFKIREMKFQTLWAYYKLVPSFSYSYFYSKWREDVLKDVITCLLWI